MPIGKTYLDQFYVQNLTNRTITLGDLVNLSVPPNGRIDLLKVSMVNKEKINQSKDLQTAVKGGWLQIIKPSVASKTKREKQAIVADEDITVAAGAHSALTGLTAPADDHTQYLLISGTRAMTGRLSFTDTTFQIWEDGVGNLTFKDSTTGTKTLADLAAGAAGIVASVTASVPITSSGGVNPDIALNVGNGLETVANDLVPDLNSTNLQITGTEINTIQDINTAATPTFAGLNAGAITGTSFIIGANTLTTSEFSFLDGINQTVATTSTPTFAGLNPALSTGFLKITTGTGVLSSTTVIYISTDTNLTASSGVDLTLDNLTAVPAEIDHDSLLNFVLGEHFLQTNIISKALFLLLLIKLNAFSPQISQSLFSIITFLSLSNVCVLLLKFLFADIFDLFL